MGIMTTEQESIVTAVVERLCARPEPPRQRWLRSEAASLYVTGGFDALHLEADRRESKREGRPPKFPFRKYGSRVLYDVERLDAVLLALPERADAPVRGTVKAPF